MKKVFYLMSVVMLVFCLVGCMPQNDNDVDIGVEVMKLEIGNFTFEANLENNTTVKALVELLPMELNMSELNGNEKYCYLDKSLPTNSKNVGQIKAGDIMLWGNDCLVIFYKTFSTPYSYTQIGHIKDVSHLQEAVGLGSVQVKWSAE